MRSFWFLVELSTEVPVFSTPNIFLLGKIDTINRRFVKNSVNYRFFSNSSINPFGARQGRRVSRWMKPRTVEPVLSSSPASL